MADRCNEITHRHEARAVWTAASRESVGLYLATEAGVIFVKIPAKVWASDVAQSKDSNGNPLPGGAS